MIRVTYYLRVLIPTHALLKNVAIQHNSRYLHFKIEVRNNKKLCFQNTNNKLQKHDDKNGVNNVLIGMLWGVAFLFSFNSFRMGNLKLKRSQGFTVLIH